MRAPGGIPPGRDAPVPQGPSDWRRRAACRGLEAEMFFPDRGDSKTTAQARTVCSICVVRRHCAAYGMRERMGIWGGMTERQRRRIRRAIRERAAS